MMIIPSIPAISPASLKLTTIKLTALACYLGNVVKLGCWHCQRECVLSTCSLLGNLTFSIPKNSRDAISEQAKIVESEESLLYKERSKRRTFMAELCAKQSILPELLA